MKKLVYYCDRCGKQMEGRMKVMIRQAYEFLAVEGDKKYCDICLECGSDPKIMFMTTYRFGTIRYPDAKTDNSDRGTSVQIVPEID